MSLPLPSPLTSPLTKVVAISGASGAGKTTLVKHLAKRFDCPFLLFDDYVDEHTYPINMKQWLHLGADLSLIKTPALTTSIAKLMSTTRSRFIFIEEPFGRERKSMSILIDYVILLDQPMALCLARIIQRHVKSPSAEIPDSLAQFLKNYEDHFKAIYINAVNQVRKNSDLAYNNIAPVHVLANDISQWLEIHSK